MAHRYVPSTQMYPHHGAEGNRSKVCPASSLIFFDICGTKFRIKMIGAAQMKLEKCRGSMKITRPSQK